MKMAGNYEGGLPQGPFIFAYGNDRQILQYFEVDAENKVRYVTPVILSFEIQSR